MTRPAAAASCLFTATPSSPASVDLPCQLHSLVRVGQAQQQTERLSDVIKDQPLASVLLAIDIGYLLGRLTAWP